MDVRPNPELADLLFEHFKEQFGIDVRRTGTHLSDLTSCLTRAYWDKKSYTPPQPQTVVMFVIGWGLEKALVGDSGGEAVELDGVIMTPDFTSMDGLTFAELKSTRMGFKAGMPSKGWPEEWIRRMMGYAKAHNRLTWELGVVQVISAQIIGATFEFTQEEVDTFWSEYVLPRRNIYESALENDVPPEPFKYADSWMCDTCRYRVLCDTYGLFT